MIETPERGVGQAAARGVFINGQFDDRDIRVEVRDGEVTLSGSVNDRRTKRPAEDVTESVSGV